MITKKVVLVGDFSTGKTSLIRRYVDNEFSDDYLTTIGVKISKKTLSLTQNEADLEIQLMIWDIEGHTSIKPTNPAYIIGAHGLLLVADITSESSLQNIGMHIQECQKIVKNTPILLALNKSDLIENEDELESTINHLKEKYSQLEAIYPTSAKNGKNVASIFLNLTETMTIKRH